MRFICGCRNCFKWTSLIDADQLWVGHVVGLSVGFQVCFRPESEVIMVDYFKLTANEMLLDFDRQFVVLYKKN